MQRGNVSTVYGVHSSFCRYIFSTIERLLTNIDCVFTRFDPAWDFIRENGIVSEEDWKYTSGVTSETGVCDKEKMKNPYISTIGAITDVPPFREELMINALAKVGPISIAIDAGKSFDLGRVVE